MRQRSALKGYLAVATISFRNTRQYTIDFLTHFIYFPVQLTALYFVYSVVYQQAWLINGVIVIGGFTLAQLISYLYVSIMFQRILPRWRLGTEVERDIDRGPLIGYLTKPIDYAGYRFFSEFPRSLLYFLFGIITYLAGMLLIQIPTPSPFNIGLFVPFFLTAYTISFLLFFTTALLAFWIGHHWWLRSFMSLLMVIAGGGLIPLTFFPPAVQFILNLLPFQYCYYIPAIILQGYYLPEQLPSIAILSVAWLVILWVLARGVWALGRRRYEGAGG